MRIVYPPNPISSLPEQTMQLLPSDDDGCDFCLASPLFEDYKYGRICVVSWSQMQNVSDYKHVFAKTLQKFEPIPFIWS